MSHPNMVIPKQDEITVELMDDGGVSIDQRSSIDGMTSGVWTANAQTSVLLAEAILEAVAQFRASELSSEAPVSEDAA